MEQVSTVAPLCLQINVEEPLSKYQQFCFADIIVWFGSGLSCVNSDVFWWRTISDSSLLLSGQMQSKGFGICFMEEI